MHSIQFFRYIRWKEGSQLNQYLMAILVVFPTLLVGMIVGWVSPALPQLKDLNGPLGYSLSEVHESWLASVQFLTSIPTTLLSGVIVNTLGRKYTILIATVSVIICWITKLIWISSEAIIVARAISGFGTGIAYAVPPIYIKEISDSEIRGTLGSMVILAQNVGIVIMYVIGDQLAFKTVLVVSLAISVVHFVVFLGAPESPAYLVQQGKIDEAREVLAWLQSKDPRDKSIGERINHIKDEDKILGSDDEVTAWKILLTDRIIRRAFLICTILLMAQESCGYLVLLTFASDIFKEADIGHILTPNQQAILIGIVQLLGSIFASCVIEKTGRKYLLMTTAFLTGLGMFSLATWFYLISLNVWTPSWLPVAAMCLSMFCTAGGFQPIPFVLVAEMFNFKVRGLVTAIAIGLTALADFIQSVAYQSVTAAIKPYGTFYIFSIICFFGGFFALIFLPETKNKTLEEICSSIGQKTNIKHKSKCEEIAL